MRTLLLFFHLLLSAVGVCAQQSDAIRKLQDDNLRSMRVLNCNKELIALSGEADSPLLWDKVIAKANECMRIDTSSVTLEIRASAWVKKGELGKALDDYALAIRVAGEDVVNAEKLNKDFAGAWADNVRQSREFHAGLYVSRSNVYVLQGKKALAQADLQRALAIIPDHYPATSGLADLDKNIREKAEEARVAHPVTVADYIFSGEQLARKGRSAEAISMLQKGLEAYPNNPELLNSRGDARRLSADPDGAIADYEAAIRLRNKFPEAYAGLGRAYLDKESWPLAVAEFTVAMEQGKKTAALLSDRGYANLHNRQYKAAVSDYTAAEKLIPRDDKYAAIGIAAGLGDAYSGMNNADEALAWYGRAIEAAKVDFMGPILAVDAWIGRGRLFASQGNKSAAEENFRAALTAVPGHKVATAELAKLKGDPGEGKTAAEWSDQGRKEYADRKYADAVASFTHSIQLDPKNAFYYSLRGYAHAANSNNIGFESDFKTAIQIAPEDKSLYFMRATLLEKKGRKAEAVDDYRRVLKLDPDHAGAKKRLEALEG